MDAKRLKASVREILEDKSKAKNLLDILPCLRETSSEAKCPRLKVVHAVQKALTHVIKRGDFDDGDNAKYKAWLVGVYDEAWNGLLSCVESTDKKLCVQAVSTLVHLWVAKGKGADESEDDWSSEDSAKFKSLMARLMSSGRDASVGIERFSEYLQYADVCSATVRCVAKMVHAVKKDESEEKKKNSLLFRRNVLRLLEVFKYPEEGDTSSLLGKTGFAKDDLQQNFSTVWTDFFWLLGRTSETTNVELYKRVLIILHDRVMPHLSKPLLLTDFLMESYNVGGSISLLALNGVFHLIHKYNLEYPDFYKKLYALLTPEVLHVKYRARFFHLSDLFLRSPLLPEYLVAAFAKRLARLALTGPAHTLTMVLQFIGNLLLRHPGLQKMANLGDGRSDDPYVMEEPDPAKCRAGESHLWEVSALQSHALPQVAHAAKFIQKLDGSSPIIQPEWNVNDLLENTYQDMFEVETKKKVFVNVPLTFEKPDTFKFPKCEIVSSLFV